MFYSRPRLLLTQIKMPSTPNLDAINPHIAQRLFATPLLIEPGKLRIIVDALAPRLGLNQSAAGISINIPAAPGDDPDGPPADADLALAIARPKPNLRVERGVAIIPVHGTLVHRFGFLDAVSGITSYQQITAWLDTALEHADVNSILLDIDSPGGEVSGIADLADAIFAAGKHMPVIAVANDPALSAAYWIASAADKIVVSQTGNVGSIGVYMALADYSDAEHAAGIIVNEITAGGLKGAGSPHHRMSASEREYLQGLINNSYELFTAKVAAYRGIDQDAVKATEAAIFSATDAIALGLADRIGSLGAELDRLAHGAADTPIGMTQEIEMPDKNQPTPTAQAVNPTPPAETPTATTPVVAAPALEATTPDPVATAQSERGRINAILTGEHAKGRDELAKHLAFNTDMSAEEAVKVLQASPAVEAEAAAGTDFNAAMESMGNPPIAPDTGDPSDDPLTEAQHLASSIIANGDLVTGVTKH
jgi:signal peptide peptidase SppA